VFRTSMPINATLRGGPRVRDVETGGEGSGSEMVPFGAFVDVFLF
jgi:hypothetical protein